MRSATLLEDLRAQIAQIEGVATRHACLPFGIEVIDGALPGGGIAAGALHEVLGSPDIADDASATIFLAGLLARFDGPVFWCLRWRDLFAPALHLAGTCRSPRQPRRRSSICATHRFPICDVIPT